VEHTIKTLEQIIKEKEEKFEKEISTLKQMLEELKSLNENNQ
jgi:uncharacterized coiled-coil protein SlyX